MNTEDGGRMPERVCAPTNGAPHNAARRFSLARRDLLAGFSSVALTSALGGCGGGGGGGEAVAEEAIPVSSGATPVVTSTHTAPGFTTTDQNRFGYLSDTQSRDQEITTWTTNGRAYLRITPAGRALYFEVNGSSLRIGIALGLNETTYHPQDHRLLMTGSMPASQSATPTFTFGAYGFDLYAKLDGVEFLRIRDFHHLQTGRTGVKQPTGGSFAPLSVTHFQDRQLFSNLAAHTYDLRDFGLKEVMTTGSISASSNSLTVQSAAEIQVGDYIIVEIGGEAGAGERGTKGVGGTWPSTSYSNKAAMDSDVGRPNGTYAWREDTGDVYRFAAGAGWTQNSAADYYVAKAVPKALTARVTAKSGNILTLSSAAATTATNARVYVDCMPIINHLAQHYTANDVEIISLAPSPMIISLPAGNFAISGSIYLPRTNNVTFQGHGMSGPNETRLFSPKGCRSASVKAIIGTNSATVKNIHIEGNARQKGFGLAWINTNWIMTGYDSTGAFRTTNAYLNSGAVTDTQIPQGPTYPHGVLFHQVSGGVMRNCKGTDIFQSFFGSSFSTNCWAYDCEYVHTEPLRIYVQWQYIIADSTGGGFDNCSFDSDYLHKGFEIFRSSGAQMLDITSRNGVLSCNNADAFLLNGIALTIEANSQFDSTSFSEHEPIINVNTNIGGSSVATGGTVSNFTITQKGYINASQHRLPSISINDNNPNITIDTGAISKPNFVATTGAPQADGINSTGSNTRVRNVTVTGASRFAVAGVGYRNIHLTGGGGSTATNCTAGDIYVNP